MHAQCHAMLNHAITCNSNGHSCNATPDSAKIQPQFMQRNAMPCCAMQCEKLSIHATTASSQVARARSMRGPENRSAHGA
eukprot:3448543-Lingulodinium_polyedra.AAC.1